MIALPQGPVQMFNNALGSARNGADCVGLIASLEEQAGKAEVRNYPEDGLVFYRFPTLGLELMFMGDLFTTVTFFHQPQDGMAQTPVSPVEPVEVECTPEEVTAELGAPDDQGTNATGAWQQYLLGDRQFVFNFGPDGRCVLSQLDLIDIPAGEASTAAEEKFSPVGYRELGPDSERIVFRDGDATLAFERHLDDLEPVTMTWYDESFTGGLLHVELTTSGTIRVRVTHEAARALGIPEGLSFTPRDSNTEELFDDLIGMLTATGEFTEN